MAKKSALTRKDPLADARAARAELRAGVANAVNDALPVVGSDSNAWGGKLNQFLIDTLVLLVSKVSSINGVTPDPSTGDVDISGSYPPRTELLPKTRSIDPAVTTVFDTFATDAVGTLPNTPTGHVYTVSSTGGWGTQGAATSGGYLTCRPSTTGGGGVVYVQEDLGPGKVPKHFQVRFILDQASTSIAMISKQMSNINVGDAWLHLEMHDTAWNLTYITNPGGTGAVFNPIASGAFTKSTPLSKLVSAKWEYIATQDTLVILLPTASSFSFGPTATDQGSAGTMVRVKDANITANIGRYMMIEPVCGSNGANASRYKAYSIGEDANASYPQPWVTLGDAAQMLYPLATPQPKDLILTADVTSNSNASLTTISGLQHTVDLTNQWYRFEGELFYDGLATLNLKLFMSVTQTVQAGRWTMESLGAAESAADAASNHLTTTLGLNLNAGTAGSGTGSELRARISGIFQSNATAGGFLIPQFMCIASPGANILTVRANSWLRITPINNIVA